MKIVRRYAIVVASLVFAMTCKDAGVPPESINPPVITAIQPDSASVGDTIRVLGARFGATQSTSTLRVGTVLFTQFAFWSDAEVRAIVPAGAVTGSVIVSVGGSQSAPHPYIIKNTVAPAISFASDIFGLFLLSAYGCDGCHAGNGTGQGWYSSTAGVTYGRLVNGNANVSSCGPTKLVLPGDASQSVLYKRLEGTCEDRMPQGGSAISSAHLSLIQQWINEGAAP